MAQPAATEEWKGKGSSFLEMAREKAAVGYRINDMRRVRDAADKAWLATLQATDAAMERHGFFPEPGAAGQATRHAFFERRGRGDLSTTLQALEDRLEGKQFDYGAAPKREAMTLDLDEVTEFIRKVREESGVVRFRPALP